MDQNNWKAWVDTMPSTPPQKPRLHVHGDIKVNDKAKYSLEPGYPGSDNTKILLLKVKPTPSAGNTDCHLEYYEDLDDPMKYDQVQIIEIETVTIEVEQVSKATQQQVAK